MKKQRIIFSQGILWAAAIISSAILGGGWFLSIILLPILAYFSMQMIASDVDQCSNP